MGSLEKGRQASGSVNPSCPAPLLASLGFHLLSASFYLLLLSLRIYLWGPQWENQVGSSSKATEKKSRAKLAFVNESLFTCQYKPLAIATYTTVHGSTVLSLWASKLLLTLFPAQKSLLHLLSFKLCCIVNVTIYTHDFLLSFYYMQRSLPHHTFYTSFPFLKLFFITAVTIPVILFHSLPLEVGPVFSDSMIPFPLSCRTPGKATVWIQWWCPQWKNCSLRHSQLQVNRFPVLGINYGVRRPLPPVPTNQDHCGLEKIPGPTAPKQRLSPTYLCPIWQPGNHLRCHPVWGTHQWFPLWHLFGNLSAESKVR